MSNDAVGWAFRQEVVSPTQKIVLLAMANYASETGLSYVSTGTLSKMTGLKKEETISAAQDELEKAGFITFTGKRTGKTGRIRIHQFPDGACSIPRETVDSIPRETDDLEGVIPRQSPVNPPSIPRLAERPNIVDRGIGSGSTIPPTIQQVRAYAMVLKVTPIEASKFHDHFESNGWKVSGKSPMKNWQAAFRNWARNSEKFNGSNGQSEPKKGFAQL